MQSRKSLLPKELRSTNLLRPSTANASTPTFHRRSGCSYSIITAAGCNPEIACRQQIKGPPRRRAELASMGTTKCPGSSPWHGQSTPATRDFSGTAAPPLINKFLDQTTTKKLPRIEKGRNGGTGRGVEARSCREPHQHS